jgi:hypothetical protein
MKTLVTLVFAHLLLGTALAQEKIARVGYLSWQDTGAFYETTLEGFIEGLR